MKLNDVYVKNWHRPGQAWWDHVASRPDEPLIELRLDLTLSHTEYQRLVNFLEQKISAPGEINDRPDLYDYLREQCPTLDAAKAWIHRWADEWGQVLPWDTEPHITLRAMAGHLSNVLEGGTSQTGYATGAFSYMDTRYGMALWSAACGGSE